ncbi:MAG: PaaI family thioesterase [Deltaproteobacteria bacterium]|nr:PaaI family thioesterase [Deltaproteobacteria bacterium]
MTEIKTHKKISRELCGVPLETEVDFSRVELTATSDMIVDERGLIHGGFIFGLADHAAMIAVNDPTVVLASANIKFMKPVRVGDRLEAQAVVQNFGKRKQTVCVTVKRGEIEVCTGEFICAILDQHVLDI